MIPSTPNQLLVAEDWKKIYQSFRNADFKSYDFETLRRTMINYLRENYPEDFNDYIDSSEYIALIDLIAFLGQNLSFRIDLNARENFLETAERRESILRLARLINYNVKRNVPASGFLKVTSISTTENVYDSSGINLANSIVGWNDSTNSSWYSQFVSIMNAAFGSATVFGKPAAKATIAGVATEQYPINTSNTDVPVYSFSKTVAGTPMSFELVPATFVNKDYVYEQPPKPGNQFSLLFKNDNKGNSSANTGFFVYFKQGSISASNFSVTNPVPNELIGVNVSNINDTDVWLWQMNANGTAPQTLWTQVPSVTGNNIIYNSLSKDERNIYGVLTRENDQVDLTFADGSFGNLPNGAFKLYYRQSNGLSYTIKPEHMNNISVQLPYTSKSGQPQVLTLILSLQYSVINSAGPESNTSIKQKAPQTYYTQNRMITAEDYNIFPLTVDSDVIKVKSINRVSSGISKYFDLSDVSGKYSKTNIFAQDGILYRNDNEYNFEFTFNSRNEITTAITSQLVPVVASQGLQSFYLAHYDRPSLTTYNLAWVQSNKTTNQSKGYFNTLTTSPASPVSIGGTGSTNLTYLKSGALVQFVPPANNYFKANGDLTTVEDDTTTTSRWIQIVNVIGDGANNGVGNLDGGVGPVTLTGNVPSGAIPVQVIPKFQNVLSYSMQVTIANIALSKRNFGLSFDTTDRSWFIVEDSNLDTTTPFSLTHQQDLTDTNLDASWLIAFVWTGKKYTVRYRVTEYVFESDKETAFFVDNSTKNYDFTTDTVIKDKVDVLSINKNPNDRNSLGIDYSWQIDSAAIAADGYIEPKKILVSMFDRNDDGQIDDPDSFDKIVAPDTVNVQTGFKNKFVYFQVQSDGLRYKYVENTDGAVFKAYPTEDDVDSYIDGQLYYFYDPSVNVIKSYSASTGRFTLEPTYYAKSGRANLKFQYVHNSGNERRLDPSKSNIIDVYMLTSTYDLEYRTWLATGTGSEPLPPTTQSLEGNYMSALEPIKGISDEIVFHPARYKVLFGSKAVEGLQATFKAVRNPARLAVSTSDIQTRVLAAIEDFFRIENWEFGQTFNFSELATYVMNIMDMDITNFVIVPGSDSSFGTLYQISCGSDEIFVNGATVNNIVVIDSLTASELKASSITTS